MLARIGSRVAFVCMAGLLLASAPGCATSDEAVQNVASTFLEQFVATFGSGIGRLATAGVTQVLF